MQAGRQASRPAGRQTSLHTDKQARNMQIDKRVDRQTVIHPKRLFDMQSTNKRLTTCSCGPRKNVKTPSFPYWSFHFFIKSLCKNKTKQKLTFPDHCMQAPAPSYQGSSSSMPSVPKTGYDGGPDGSRPWKRAIRATTYGLITRLK